MVSSVILREKGQTVVALDSYNNFLDSITQDYAVRKFEFNNYSGTHKITLSNIRTSGVTNDIRTCRYNDLTYAITLTIQATYECRTEDQITRNFSHRLPFGSIPLMTGCKYCPLAYMTEEQSLLAGV